MGKFCDACGRAASRLIARGKSILRQRGRKKRAKSRIAKYSWDKQYYGLKLKSVSKDIDLDGDDVQEINCRDIFCGDHGDREKYLLTWAELFTFAICTRFSVSYITVQMYMMTNFGPALTFSLSTFIMICTCVPVQSGYIFLGNFTKRYFVRFWDCVPILKGLPFALIIYSIPMQIYNVYFAGQALYYISKLIRSGTIPWENCDFDGACDECTPI
nr:uncharacterized protein LOC111419313 [Onthophagus taurus]